MYLSDVEQLLADETAGQQVVSWHSRAIWDACKSRVRTDEHARRLSKLMRDNRHSLMHALWSVADIGSYAFLATLLELDWANYKVSFVNLHIEDHLTVFDELKRTRRITKYADEQKARRCRIAFKELTTYFEKANRNVFVVQTPASDKLLAKAARALAGAMRATRVLDAALKRAASSKGASDATFRRLMPRLVSLSDPCLEGARLLLARHMDAVGKELSTKWDDPRYVRRLDEEDEPNGG
jgi:hypothetical protein